MAADPRPADPRPDDPRPALPAPAAGDGPYRICLVCLGNICRSPMAEVILRDEVARAGLAGRVTVESAGTGDWHIGGPMDPRASADLASRGYDGSAHIARQISADWLGAYDLFVAMDARNLGNLRKMAASHRTASRPAPRRDTARPDDGRIRLMRSFDPAAAPGAEVPDPYNGGPAAFSETFTLVRAAARGLTAQLSGLLTPDNL
jgi:protein-tyrosine phosphatase